MSSDDIDLGQQTGLASQLSKSLAEATSRMNSFSDSSRTQAKFAIDIADSFKQTSNYLDNMSNSTEKINNCLDSFLQNVKNLSTNSGMNEFFKSFVKHIDETTDRFKKTANATEELSDVAEKAQTSAEKSQESLNKAAKDEKKYATAHKQQTKEYIENLTRANKSADAHNKTQEEFAEAAEEAEKAGRSWAQAFKSTISFGLNLIKMIGSLISTATTWVKTVFTLPGILIFASMTAYLIAQLIDIRIFHYIKRITNSKYLWLRNNCSTMVSQLIDTIIVNTIYFWKKIILSNFKFIFKFITLCPYNLHTIFKDPVDFRFIIE